MIIGELARCYQHLASPNHTMKGMIFHLMTDPYYLHLREVHKDSRSLKHLLKQYKVSEIRFFEDTPCWEWQGFIDAGGYGRCRKLIQGFEENYAHRASYRAFVGSIPEGHEIDHKCRYRKCGNPLHLRPLTHRQNIDYRSESKIECLFGHAFSPENTAFDKKGTRICKACRYRRIKEWRERHPEKARAMYRRDKAQWRVRQREDGDESDICPIIKG